MNERKPVRKPGKGWITEAIYNHTHFSMQISIVPVVTQDPSDREVCNGDEN